MLNDVKFLKLPKRHQRKQCHVEVIIQLALKNHHTAEIYQSVQITIKATVTRALIQVDVEKSIQI